MPRPTPISGSYEFLNAAVAREPVRIDGEIFGVQDPAAACAAALQRDGGRGVRDLDGFFAAACPGRPSGVLTLVTDAIGSRPLYWARDGNSVRFGSSACDVIRRLGHAPALDERGIVQQVVLGFSILERTLWLGVNRVPPATVLAIGRERVEARRTWEMRYALDASSPRSLRAGVALVRDAFLRAFERMNPESGPFLLPLSGGMDSRLIAAALAATGKQARAVTIGGDGAADLALAAEVARRLGFQHEQFVMRPEDVGGWLVDGARITDGMSYAFDTHALYLANRLGADGAIVLDGTSSIDGFYSIFDLWMERWLGRRRTPIEMIWDVCTGPLFGAEGELLMPELIAPARREAWREHLRASLESMLAAIPAEFGRRRDCVDWLEMRYVIPRNTLNGAMLLRCRHEVRHPFFAREFLDVVGRLPLAMRVKEKPVLGRVCVGLAPVLADLPYERTSLPADASLLRLAIARMKQGLGRLAAKAIPAIGPPRRRVSIDYGAWLRQDPGLQQFVRGIVLAERTLARGWFAPDALANWLEDVFRGRRQGQALLSRLLSLEIGLRAAEDRGGGLSR
jgi:asparagine synthetase B (glutamine-hydrolysing)